MGRSPYGWNDNPGYLGFADANHYSDYRRKSDREDALREQLERADAARAKASEGSK